MELMDLNRILETLQSIDQTLTEIKYQIHAQQYEHDKMLTAMFSPILHLGVEVLSTIKKEVDQEVEKENHG